MSARPILTLRWSARNDNPPPRRHSVVIAPEPFGFGYDVFVTPPPDGIGHDREFRAYKAARAYADRLADRMGWALVDRVGDGDEAA